MYLYKKPLQGDSIWHLFPLNKGSYLSLGN